MKPFPGLSVGHATDAALKSGTTVLLPDAPAVAAVQITGGAPASREAAALSPENSVEHIDAIVLTGGSAFGLAAADGAMDWLAAHGRGFEVGGRRVPIAPAASLFDLNNGGAKPDDLASIYRALGRAACEAAQSAASGDVALGSVGAGTGATTADLKGGFGAAESVLGDGARVAAFVAVNAVGRVTLGTTPHFRAAAFERIGKPGGEFGGLGLPGKIPADAGDVVTKLQGEPGGNTTIAVIVTDAVLTRAQAKRLAITAHDGMALAIYPAHTPFDGDTVFALSTGARSFTSSPLALVALCAAAAETLARAISIAVYAATPAENDRFPTWRQRYFT